MDYYDDRLFEYMIPLWIPDRRPFPVNAARVWNMLLVLLFFPFFLLGIHVLLATDFTFVSYPFGILRGFILGYTSGILLHEMSHAAAGISYGADVLEGGIGFEHYLPGAYVLIDDRRVKNRFYRAQIYAAGAEMNLLLCGAFLCLLKIGLFDSVMLLIAAFLNALLALINTALINGADGMKILGCILGLDDPAEVAGKVTKSRVRRKKLRERGLSGHALIFACYVIKAYQLILILLFVISIYNIYTVFFH